MSTTIRNPDEYPPGVHERLILALNDPRTETLWEIPRAQILSPAIQWPEELTLACFELASAWGQARLFGVPQDPSAPDGDWLSVAESLAAAPAIISELDSLLETSMDLEGVWTPFNYELGDGLLCSVIERRHALWGICEAMRHGYDHDCALLFENGGNIEDFAHLQAVLSEIDRKIQEIDDVLTGVAPQQILSTAAELPLLRNYRRWLVSPFWSQLPWWLDGSLDIMAQLMYDDVVSGFGRCWKL